LNSAEILRIRIFRGGGGEDVSGLRRILRRGSGGRLGGWSRGRLGSGSLGQLGEIGQSIEVENECLQTSKGVSLTTSQEGWVSSLLDFGNQSHCTSLGCSQFAPDTLNVGLRELFRNGSLQTIRPQLSFFSTNENEGAGLVQERSDFSGESGESEALLEGLSEGHEVCLFVCLVETHQFS
jgi:hypothetical protein